MTLISSVCLFFHGVSVSDIERLMEPDGEQNKYALFLASACLPFLSFHSQPYNLLSASIIALEIIDQTSVHRLLGRFRVFH